MRKRYTLNMEQQAAADGFLQFLFSPDPELIISGPPGTGKTVLLGEMIDEIEPQYKSTCKLMGIKPEYDQVVMTATTNKAVEVVSQSTGKSMSTVQSFLNLKVQDDYVTGKSKLTKVPSQWRVHERTILFIDECSMIDRELNKYIKEGTHKCKIVYVGDHCQLAPIGETISQVFRKGSPFFQLTEPMRNNSQPALVALCNQLRHTVETGEFKPIQIIPGVIDLLDDDQMERMIIDQFQMKATDSRILAFTNNRVIQFNDHIRSLRLLPDRYTVGEMLVNNNAIRLRNSMLSVEQEVTIKDIADKNEFIPIDSNVNLEIMRAKLTTSNGGVHENVALPVDRKHFLALIKFYQSNKNWPKYYDLKNNYPDLRQRDASTLHKAQGSTYESVFIDLSNLSTCNISHVVARLLYVGISRARTRVFLYGKLADKYGGLKI